MNFHRWLVFPSMTKEENEDKDDRAYRPPNHRLPPTETLPDPVERVPTWKGFAEVVRMDGVEPVPT